MLLNRRFQSCCYLSRFLAARQTLSRPPGATLYEDQYRVWCQWKQNRTNTKQQIVKNILAQQLPEKAQGFSEAATRSEAHSDHMIFVNIVDWLGNRSPRARGRGGGASVTGRPHISEAID